MLGLPQVKLGWIIAGGTPAIRRAAVDRLEHVADTFLSVSTPVQVAAPTLLERGAEVRHAIHRRIRRNLHILREAVSAYPALEVPRVEGGWSAVVRMPAVRSEESFVLDLLTRERFDSRRVEDGETAAAAALSLQPRLMS
jgi:aspartate/methionine/tyrosine aminotransferase